MNAIDVYKRQIKLLGNKMIDEPGFKRLVPYGRLERLLIQGRQHLVELVSREGNQDAVFGEEFIHMFDANKIGVGGLYIFIQDQFGFLDISLLYLFDGNVLCCPQDCGLKAVFAICTLRRRDADNAGVD